MDIASLSTAISPTLNQSQDALVTKTDTVISEKTLTLTTGETQKVAVDSNLGQHLDIVAGLKADIKEETKEQLKKEIQWMQDRERMINIKEGKLLQMREIAQQGIQSKPTPREIKVLNDRLDILASQVSSIDIETKRTKGGKKLE